MRSDASSKAVSAREMTMALVRPLSLAPFLCSLLRAHALLHASAHTHANDLAYSPRDVHYPSSNPRVHIQPHESPAPRGEKPAVREAACDHCRRQKVRQGPRAQDQGEREWDFFDRQDVEPRRPLRDRVLHRSKCGPGFPPVGGRQRVCCHPWQVLLLGGTDRQRKEVLHCQLDQDLRQIHWWPCSCAFQFRPT